MDVAKNDMSLYIKCIVLAICILFNIFALSNILFGEQSIIALQNAKESLNKIKAQIAEVDQKNAQLSNEIRLLKTDQAYLEKVIRQQLNYVRGSEIIYIFEEEEANPYWQGAGIDE